MGPTVHRMNKKRQLSILGLGEFSGASCTVSVVNVPDLIPSSLMPRCLTPRRRRECRLIGRAALHRSFCFLLLLSFVPSRSFSVSSLPRVFPLLSRINIFLYRGNLASVLPGPASPIRNSPFSVTAQLCTVVTLLLCYLALPRRFETPLSLLLLSFVPL